VEVEPVNGVAGGVNRLSPKPVLESCTHQAWSLPCPIEFYSSSSLHHFGEVCRKKITHA
jgi:hypothetical protein